MAVRRLADRGVAAIPALVWLASSGNGDVSDAAQDAVQNSLAKWEMSFAANHDEQRFAEQLQALAAALDVREATDNDDFAFWSAGLAIQLARHSERLKASSALELLNTCERVLAAALGTPPQPPIKPPAAGAVAGRRADDPPSSASTAQAPRPEIGRLHLGANDADGELRFLEEALGRTSDEGDRLGLLVDTANSVTPPIPAILAPPAAADLPQAVLPRALPAPAGPEPIDDVPSPLEARFLQRQLRRLSDRDLTYKLISATPYEALAIQQILDERNSAAAASPFTQQVAPRRVGDERALYDRLGNLPTAEARDLLRALVADGAEETEIRLQALTLLATSGDPQLETIARERAMEDADPRVAELATRILRERQAK
jgi:hypothetical protein